MCFLSILQTTGEAAGQYLLRQATHSSYLEEPLLC